MVKPCGVSPKELARPYDHPPWRPCSAGIERQTPYFSVSQKIEVPLVASMPHSLHKNVQTSEAANHLSRKHLHVYSGVPHVLIILFCF